MNSDESNLHHEALLLLSSAPSLSFHSLKEAYADALSSVLSTHSKSVKGTSRTVVLDIAISTRGLCSPDAQPRAKTFDRLQQLLASFYKLLAATSASLSIELDGPGGVDARVFFLDQDSAQHQAVPLYGPIVSLQSLVASQRSWNMIYALDTEEYDALATDLASSASGSSFHIRKLPGPGVVQQPTDLFRKKEDISSTPHYSVAVGGTFDHLHAGHKLLLTATALALDAELQQPSHERKILTIGITGDELLVNKKYAEFLETWEERWRGVWVFLRSIVEFSPPDKRNITISRESNPGANGKRVIVRIAPDLELRFVQISDPFGPTITDEDITALVVSKETRSGGKAVNDEREKKGWATLEVFEVDVLDAGEEIVKETDASSESFESKISSTEIRRRRMNLAKGSL